MTDIALDEIRRRVRNIWGAISSNQVIDKDVEGQARQLLEYVDDLRRASPSQVAPANPAQVMDAMVAEAAKSLGHEGVYISYETIRRALTAAIGAGGQAVAAKEMDAALDRLETAAFAKFANLPRGKADREKAIANRAAEYNSSRQAILSALSQPHPADERVVEALEWYAVQVAGCRKVTSEGNDARAALNNDGGKRALAALSAKECR